MTRTSAKCTRAAPASLVIIGDAFHTFVDGAVIAAAVLTSVPLGITTALAVAAHEIPQEVGDVAILLRAGYSRLARVHAEPRSPASAASSARSAMLLASESVPNGAAVRPVVRGRNFLYVAMSDLIPDLHRGGSRGRPIPPAAAVIGRASRRSTPVASADAPDPMLSPSFQLVRSVAFCRWHRSLPLQVVARAASHRRPGSHESQKSRVDRYVAAFVTRAGSARAGVAGDRAQNRFDSRIAAAVGRGKSSRYAQYHNLRPRQRDGRKRRRHADRQGDDAVQEE